MNLHKMPAYNLSTLLLCSCLLVSIGGCAASEVAAESEIDSERNDWIEIKIDDYTVAVLVADDPAKQPDFNKYQESVALHFTLLCLVRPDDITEITTILSDKKGQLSDEIIRTCRNASLIDLADPDLRLIRAHMREFTEELIGPNRIRQYVFSGVSLEKY